MKTGFARFAATAMTMLMVVGCASATPTPITSPTATAIHIPSDTAYGRLFAQVQPDGTVSKDVARLAFSTAIAALPGVPVATGSAPQEFERADGTFAIDWLWPYMDQLTPEQRAAVDAALKPTEAARIVEPLRQLAVVGGAASLQQPAVAADSNTQVYLDAIAYAEAEIPKRLGRTLKAKVNFDFGSEVPANLPKALGYSFPGPSTKAPRCEIRATPLIEGGSDQRIRAAMAHEVFHCFQFEVWPPGSGAMWVIEGQAEWAGEDIGGPSSDGNGWWETYVLTPNDSLFGRIYDAVGFYEHLLERGVNPWTIFDAMLKTPADDKAAFKAAKADTDTFLNSWASGYRTDATPTAWYAHGRWPTAEHTDPNPLNIVNGKMLPLEAKPASNTLYLLKSTADITSIAYSGRVRLLMGTRDISEVGGFIDLCTKGATTAACDCPEGFTYTGPILDDAELPIWLGVTGGLDGTTGEVVGRDLDQFCQPTPSGHPQPSPRGGPDPCADGCAGSVGDPHFHTIDQQEYDFQAAGEYTLLRSADGSMEMQAREIAYPDVTNAAINTALAWRVAGHRVGMYAGSDSQSDTYTLFLDGQQLDPLAVGTRDLGGGAALTALETGVEVAYADGTIATGLFHGNGFENALDIQVAPSDAFRAQAAGLLAPIAAGSELPALPDGSSLALSTDRATRFEQRYQQLAPAWHVTDQTSLFDYKAGENSATFDQPGFPSPDVPFDLQEFVQSQGLGLFQDASEKCAAIGGDQQQILKCVFDILATHDPAYAEMYKLVQQFLAQGPEALENTGPTITPPPPPTPGGLPSGFVQVASDVSLIKGSTVGPDGTLYLSVNRPDYTYELLSIDATTGAARESVVTPGGGPVSISGGSLWLAEDDVTGFNRCMLVRLDPATLAEQGKLQIGCDIAGPSVVTVADGIWWIDRSTADIDGKGGMLRHVDPQTAQVDRSVELPFLNGSLSASTSTVFYGDTLSGYGWFRLTPGAVAFAPMPVPERTFAMHPGGDGLWIQPAPNGTVAPEADLFTGAADPPQTVQFESGSLVGADDLAVYVNKSGDAGVATLWRYPIDGSPPGQLLTGDTLTTANGDMRLEYFANAALVIGNGYLVKLWQVGGYPTADTSAVIAQSATVP